MKTTQIPSLPGAQASISLVNPFSRENKIVSGPLVGLPILVAALFFCSMARGQPVGARIDKVWEFLINKPGILLPTLTNLVADTTDNEIGDGHYPMDTLSALRRYDANRLILGIRENGIDETATNLTPAQIALSTNYPD